MIFLESIKSNLTLAVLLKDDLAPDKKAFGDIFLNVPRKRKDIIRGSTGHFLLVDLPEVNQIITGGGKYYNQCSLIIDYKHGKLYANDNQIEPENPLIIMPMSPKSSYPFPEGMTILKGKLVDTENKPISQASINVVNMAPSAISEEDGEYFIKFTALNVDKTVILNINKDGYESAKQAVPLKKGATTRAEIAILTKL